MCIRDSCCFLYGSFREGALSQLMIKAFYRPQIVDNAKCTGCNRCACFCPTNATWYDKERAELVYDIDRCIGCGQCVTQCPSGYRSMEMCIRDSIKEKDINLVIAKKLQWYLEQNDNLNVIMTRTSDTDVSIGGRIDYAKGNNADYVISVHINSKSQDNTNPRGCMVLMSLSLIHIWCT